MSGNKSIICGGPGTNASLPSGEKVFRGLSKTQRDFLLETTEDPASLDTKEVENFRRLFLDTYPGLPEERIPNAHVMRRVMAFANAERERHATAVA